MYEGKGDFRWTRFFAIVAPMTGFDFLTYMNKIKKHRFFLESEILSKTPFELDYIIKMINDDFIKDK